MLIGLLALALVDSINPSAIAGTVYRLGQGRTAAHVVIYIIAICGTYLALGATMMLGLDAVLPSVRPLAEGRLGFIVQSLIGLAMLFYAVRAPAFSPSAPRTEPHAATFAAIALLGVTVTALELPTAVPYFGVIALLTAANLSTVQWLPLLVVYNAIFVLPPCCCSRVTLLLGATWRSDMPTSESGSRRVLIRRCCGSLVSSAAEYSSRASSSTSPDSCCGAASDAQTVLVRSVTRTRMI